MRWVLPGGAVVGGGRHEGTGRPVACRPLAGVVERWRRVAAARAADPTPAGRADTAEPIPVGRVPPGEAGVARLGSPSAPAPAPGPAPPKLAERLGTAKLLIEVLVALVGLIAAVLALFGLSRK